MFSAAALLTGCPTVDLGDSPTDIGDCNPAGGIEYFTTQVYPNYIQPTNTTRGCTQSGLCHNEGSSNLLIFRNSPRDDAFNYKAAQNFIDCGMPTNSPLLTKPVRESDPHGGGELFPMSDPSVQIFLDWFAE